ncbi:DUF4302 domain-containing protein [Bacteroides sp. ET71]|uniref:DUF4302 domain-containing protein n=1 Tax=Bacteroides sp. ET71 TaxID=2939421 RepID=UPI002011558C|nr:DUF4302 domain-containing protein [Bacteroides sp. ET71]MCL1617544.1 DUF4302 domain-containing protein [Bacteroides sp. ET71]
MKKLYKMLYMAAAVLLAAACTPEEDDIFSDSSANRADAAIEADMQVLTGAANGWLMEYYPEMSQTYGGYNILLSFSEDGHVTVAGDVANPTDTSTSLFSVKQSAGIVLSFDTYNEIFHFFSDPGNSQGGGNAYGLEGDYDFLILEATPQQVKLKGKKSGSYAVLTPMEGDWATYIQEIQAAESAMLAAQYNITDGTNSATASVNYRNMTINYMEGEEALSMPAPFIVTLTGIKFYEPITLWGQTISGFTYDFANDSFTANEQANITMKREIPPINQTFITGNWFMTYESMGSFAQAAYARLQPALAANGIQWGYIFLGDMLLGEFGFNIVDNTTSATVFPYDYQLVGEDQVILYWNGMGAGNATLYYSQLGISPVLEVFGNYAPRTFTLTTDDPESPTEITLTDNAEPSNVITMYAAQVQF